MKLIVQIPCFNEEATLPATFNDIPKLIQPILDGKADGVVGDRNTAKVAHFSPFKKNLQRIAVK